MTNLHCDVKCMRCERLIRVRLPEDKFSQMTLEQVNVFLVRNQLRIDKCPYCGIQTFQLVVTPAYVPSVLLKKVN